MEVSKVLDFWFGPQPGEFRKAWFEKNAEFDASCRAELGELAERAASGALDSWADTGEGALALIVLLDQLPRNLHRGTPKAFASDAHALRIARATVAKGFDRELPPALRMFVYLPFEHAEDLATQDESCALMRGLPDEWPMKALIVEFADKHRDAILKFGRYPHRNAILGRADTEAEKAYLAQPNAGF